MTDTPRETQVLDAVVTLVDSLLDDFDVVDLLTDLTDALRAAARRRCRGPSARRPAAAAAPAGGDLGAGARTGALPAAGRRRAVRRVLHHRPTGIGRRPAAPQSRRWPRFVPAALDAGFASVHAVPMRAAGIVLGAVGLFGTRPGELNEADLLVAQTLAHIACVAILQEHPPTPDTVMPQLRSALAGRVVVEQAKGFLRESLDVSVEDAFRLLRTYARASGQHLTDVARRLMTDRDARPELVAALAELATAPPRLA